MASIIQDKESGNWTQPLSRKTLSHSDGNVTYVASGSATEALNLDANINVRSITIAGNRAFAAPTSGIDDDTELWLYITCDGTDRTPTFGTGFESHGTVAIESSTTACLRYAYRTNKFVEVSRSFTTAS